VQCICKQELQEAQLLLRKPIVLRSRHSYTNYSKVDFRKG